MTSRSHLRRRLEVDAQADKYLNYSETASTNETPLTAGACAGGGRLRQSRKRNEPTQQ